MRDADFERLYEEHAAGLFSFLAYRTGDRGLAEDLVSETFERVLRARSRFDPRRGKQKTWVYSIALNLLRDSARRRDAEGRALERTMVAARVSSEPYARLDDRDALRVALERLSPAERDAISLRFGADLTVPEIAKLTGEKLTTVEGRVYRALRKLSAELG